MPQQVKDRREFILWWVGAFLAVIAVVVGFCLMLYGSTEDGSDAYIVIGFALIGWNAWNFFRILSLRRYMWYGDLS